MLEHFARNGQKPYAIVIGCSDSRVIPERIFHAAMGDLFTIRVAGNVIDDHQLGSIEYAAGHLGTKLILVLGHTQCGAVTAAIDHDPGGYIKFITDEIKRAIGDEKDDYKAAESCFSLRIPCKTVRPGFAEQSQRIFFCEGDGLCGGNGFTH